MLVFDNGYFSEFGTFSITDWIGHTPRDVLAKTFGVPAETFASFPKDEVYIAKGPVPPAVAGRAQARIAAAAARSRTAIACWRKSRRSIAAAPTVSCRSGSFRSRRP